MPGLRRLTSSAALILFTAAGAWAGVAVVAHHMGSMPGTMGLGVGAFAAVWALMALLVAFGLMNVIAMVVLAGAVFAEKTWVWGPQFSRVLGITALGLAVAVVFAPGLAPGLHPVANPGQIGGM
jgi:predicted metal-binding membrane protein